ncbi:acetylornithine transaminase [Candidatus Oleimmundimicrobium sp.]|uniref:acetylornithine transaminase n=1 Tax=Candidatus Oleimmundimicrobium sp. TaxID=3060597 RepID=UPI00272710FF|nr:acetylornithine transaminase [Candidatus Oleimmundimicrobium sp.]MDO8886114.1 acetylornithine transaminase [Candidatus Oleimmundimicrobium sp.]
MDFEDYVKKDSQYHIDTYTRLPVLLIKGKGCTLWDINGKSYLDFLSGIGVTSVGHCHPTVVNAVKSQMEQLVHVSNLFYTIPQIKLAEKLVSISFGDKCFFANSGAEANEGAVKLARKYSKTFRGEDKYEIITAYRSFHGRTMKMLAASGQPEKQKPFEPMPIGFKHVPLNDFKALKGAITDKTGAVMLEPIQGEGGVYPCNLKYLQDVRRFCDEKGFLLILDEVQTGIGRTGRMFAYEHFGIEPDIISLAKGLGGGLPIGAIIAKDEVAKAFEPGDHGSTFGGGPVACTAALAALKIIEDEELVENSEKMGEIILEKLQKMSKKIPIKEIRGKGLMIGIELEQEMAKEVVSKCLNDGLIVNNIGSKIIRLLPPLCITKDEVNMAMKILEKALTN